MKKRRQLSYPKWIALGYLLIIAVGTLLLMLPCATNTGQSAGFTSALFTATSATCVTGLIVADTCLYWSLFGQIVILCLIQIGGLGFMTVVTMFSLLLHRRIGLHERSLLRDSVSLSSLDGVVRLMKRILIGTFMFEALGAFLLSFAFVPKLGAMQGIFYGIFHSISAFCNAGFDLMGRFGAFSSLTSWADNPLVILTIAFLIIVGGIGFVVWDDIIKHKWKFRAYQLHSKIALSVTGILLAGGTILFYLAECNGVLRELSWPSKLLNAFFGAATPRTAGFNSVDLTALSPSARFLTVILMFIGGSPGSTAGGIKTTTVAVLFITMLSGIYSRKADNVFGRRLEESASRRALTVLMVNLSCLLPMVFLLSLLAPGLPLSDTVFESVSALCTVGLSIGATAAMGTVARMGLVLLMYCGRVGSLSLALLVTEGNGDAQIVLRPEEKINIG